MTLINQPEAVAQSITAKRKTAAANLEALRERTAYNAARTLTSAVTYGFVFLAVPAALGCLITTKPVYMILGVEIAAAIPVALVLRFALLALFDLADLALQKKGTP